MNRCIALLIFCFSPTVFSQTLFAPPKVDHVLIISIDGLRPDVLLRANTPTLHALCDRGSFSFWALTAPVSITLPSHASMLTGEPPEKHGINFNDERAALAATYPTVPTLFELAHAAGFSTAMVAGKEKFLAFAKPGTVDFLWLPDQKVTADSDVADHASKILLDHQPQVMFVHFPGADVAGHASGWGSSQQLDAVALIDQSIARLVKNLDDLKITDSTLLIVTADHGGNGRQHGADQPANRYIPWIAVGPGVEKNFDLTLLRNLTINTEDTFATACWAMHIPLPENCFGKPIVQILHRDELIGNVPATMAVK